MGGGGGGKKGGREGMSSYDFASMTHFTLVTAPSDNQPCTIFHAAA